MSLIGLVGGETEGWERRLQTHLQSNYLNNAAEKARRAAARKRDEFYAGAGDAHIIELIQLAFKNELVREMREKLVARTKWNNVTARVVNEKASVYKTPARRTVGGDQGNAERYRRLCEALGMDQVAQAIDRKLALHEDVWVQYRIREEADGTKAPTIDVVSPASFWAICDPRDRTKFVGIVVDSAPADANASPAEPHYYAVSPSEAFMLDATLMPIASTIQRPAGGPAMSGFLATTKLPGTKESGGLLADAPSADLVAAHESVWFQSTLLLKESTSVNNQTYLSGDLSRAAMGQPADTTTDVVLPEGASVQAVNRGVDLTQYTTTSDHILERAGANHGLPPSVLHHRDSSSGQEIHLRRIPIRELREERIPFLRSIEWRLARIQSAMNASGLPDLAFDVTGWAIDFAEVQQPMTEQERDATFETQRRLLLTDTIEEVRRRNPDLRTDDEARAILAKRLDNETRRVIDQRVLMALGEGPTSSPDSSPGPGNSGSTDTRPE